ncbi:MAG: hypothetical protein ACE5DM_05730 [Candidatus Nanoarchaeia archaeon]
MSELRILSEEEMHYEGLFDAKELYALIDEFFNTKSYDKLEPEHKEIVMKEGKDIEIIYQPYKKVSDYVELRQRIEIRMRHLIDVEVEIDKKRKKLKKGEINIIFKPMIASDYEGKWEQRASYLFIRTIMEKFFYRKYTEDFESMCMKDMTEIRHKIGGFLNLHRYSVM